MYNAMFGTNPDSNVLLAALYIRDEDEKEQYDAENKWLGGDMTYATFYFRMPPSLQSELDLLLKNQGSTYDVSVDERFKLFMDEMKTLSKEELLKRHPGLTSVVKALDSIVSKEDD